MAHNEKLYLKNCLQFEYSFFNFKKNRLITVLIDYFNEVAKTVFVKNKLQKCKIAVEEECIFIKHDETFVLLIINLHSPVDDLT